MAEDQSDTSTEPPTGVDRAAATRTWWWQRPTIRTLRRDQSDALDVGTEWDSRENDESRLPNNESVHLGGLVLVEVFTPSTVSSLYAALNRLPTSKWDRPTNWREGVSRNRSSGAGGWQNLGMLRPPGDRVLGAGGNDADLPPGVQGVWLSLHYLG